MCKHIAQNRFNSRIIPCYDMHTRQKNHQNYPSFEFRSQFYHNIIIINPLFMIIFADFNCNLNSYSKIFQIHG